MNVSYNNLFLIKSLYLIRRARLVCTISLFRTLYYYSTNNATHFMYISKILRESQCMRACMANALILSFNCSLWFYGRFSAYSWSCTWSLLITKISSLANQLFVWLHISLFAESSEKKKKIIFCKVVSLIITTFWRGTLYCCGVGGGCAGEFHCYGGCTLSAIMFRQAINAKTQCFPADHWIKIRLSLSFTYLSLVSMLQLIM